MDCSAFAPTALIGCGRWATHIARHLASLGVLAGVYDCDAMAAAHFAATYETYAYPHLDALVNDAHTQAVVIAAPPETHSRLTLHALAAHKDVLVEKPATLTLAEARAMVHHAQTMQRVCMVGYLLAYHPAAQAFLALAAPITATGAWAFHSQRLALLREDIGRDPVTQLAPHDLWGLAELAHDTTGMEPLQVTIERARSQECELLWSPEDVRLAVPRAYVHVGYHRYTQARLWYVRDADAENLVIWDDARPWESKVTTWDAECGYQHALLRPEDALRNELTHFLTCCQTREEPQTSAAQMLPVAQLLEDAQHARAACVDDV